MNVDKIILNALHATAYELIILTGFLIGAGLVLNLIENKTNYYISQSFGRLGILLTALIGTPIHEIGHLLMCIIFRHRINSVKLLNISKNSSSLGSVSHSFDGKNPYQRIGNFFIGLGPLFSASAAISISMYILLPDVFFVFKQAVSTNKFIVASNGWTIELLTTFNSLIYSLFTLNNLYHWEFWVFIVIAMSISAHTSLSKSDINNVYDGTVSLFILLFCVNVVAAILSIDTAEYIITLGRFNYYLASLIILIAIFAAVNFIVFASL